MINLVCIYVCHHDASNVNKERFCTFDSTMIPTYRLRSTITYQAAFFAGHVNAEFPGIILIKIDGSHYCPSTYGTICANAAVALHFAYI